MKNDKVIEYLESLTKDDIYGIIKYGLRNTDCPVEINVEDIFNIIGCMYNDTK